MAGTPSARTAQGAGRTLVCVGGAPGAGKTTVGSLVAHAAGLCLVDLDSVTTPLVEAFAAALGDVADLDAPRFVALRDARYSCLAAVASDNLRAGRDVVAVAPFTAESTDATAWRAQGARWGADRVVLCWLDVDPAESARRAAARGLPRDLAKTRVPSRAPVAGRQRVLGSAASPSTAPRSTSSSTGDGRVGVLCSDPRDAAPPLI